MLLSCVLKRRAAVTIHLKKVIFPTGTIRYGMTAGKVYVAFDILCGAASILNLTIISIERTFAVKSPAKHRNLSRNRPIIYGGIASVWIIAMLLAFLHVYVLPAINPSKFNIIILVIMIFFIPTFIIIGSYVMIFHAVKTRVLQHKTIKKEVRLAAMIGIVIILFLFCWFPFFLFNILSEHCSCWNATFSSLIPAVKYLHYGNSTMNPIIYAYRNADYRRAFKKIIYHVFTCGRTVNLDTRSERAMSFRSTLPSQGNSACREFCLSPENEKIVLESSTALLEVKQIRNGHR